ncbi:unnamed protein product [Rhizoctonia solani]|uniref:PNPLA domain-containing protein n=1 Tax=Rhizoctonia solani TaxID=456999 RepID=A0A8H3EB98_9AGAM|nr:unnamed protein product [Rhizoctonia solani]
MALVNAACMRSTTTIARHLNNKPLCRSVLLNQKCGGPFGMHGALTAKSLIHSHSKNLASALDLIPPVSPLDQDRAQRPARILSLDGGGVRGLSSVMILREFMTKLEKASGATKPIIPADFFDLIIGTSTGGILALLFGRLRMNVDEVLDMYQTLSKEVFHTGPAATAIHSCTTFLKDGVPSMYDESILERLIKQTIADKTKGGDPEALLLEDSSPDSCLTAVVTARSADATRPILMRSYTFSHDADPEKFKIWEAARATSAAPLFFRPIKAGGYEDPYIDGCLSGHCNPSWQAIQEAKRIWPKPSRKSKIGLFMSLGTGSPSKVPLRAPIHSFILGFVYLASNTVQIHEMAWREFKRKYEVSPYVRLSVDHDISKIRLDDPSRLDDIKVATLTYLEFARTSEKIQRCVELATGTKPSKLNPCNEPHEDEEDTVRSEGLSSDLESVGESVSFRK